MHTDSFWGQQSTLLLFSVTAAWAALRTGRERLAGAALGVALAAKLFGIPTLLFLAVRRRGTAAAYAAGICIAANGLALLFAAPTELGQLIVVVLPLTTKLYLPSMYNQSLVSVLYRLIAGRANFDSSPWDGVVDAATHGSDVALAGAAAFVVCAGILWTAVRAQSFELGLAIALVLSTFFQPPTWSFTTLCLAVPLGVAALHAKSRWMPALLAAAWFAAPTLRHLQTYPGWMPPKTVPSDLALAAAPFVSGMLLLIFLCAISRRKAATTAPR
jgi:hypothetical protein